jgi:hypothetical protein
MRRLTMAVVLFSSGLMFSACDSDSSSTGSGGSGGTGGRGGAAGGGAGGHAGGAGTGGYGGTGGAGRGGTTGTAGAGGSTGGSGGGAAGSGGSGGGGGGTGTFAPVATLLGMSCGIANCHDGAAAHTDLRNNAGLHGRLVGKMPPSGVTDADCKSQTLVVAGNPTMSLLSNMVKEPAAGRKNCAVRMPDDCAPNAARKCLTDAQIKVIDDWISAGAPM